MTLTTEDAAKTAAGLSKLILERGESYGHPGDTLERTAGMLSLYFGREFTAQDVCAIMAIVKLARISNDPEKQDSWLDAACFLIFGGA